MRNWWRSELLNDGELSLLRAVEEAHLLSALRNNASSAAVANAAHSSRNMVQAIAAGLMTLGELHGPIEQTVRFLSSDNPMEQACRILKRGGRVPGWGGTFQKDQPDPVWDNVAKILKEFRPDLHDKLDRVTAELHAHDKHIYPNPSAYTAATAIALMIDARFAVWILISGRLDAWAKIAADYMTKKEG